MIVRAVVMIVRRGTLMGDNMPWNVRQTMLHWLRKLVTGIIQYVVGGDEREDWKDMWVSYALRCSQRVKNASEWLMVSELLNAHQVSTQSWNLACPVQIGIWEGWGSLRLVSVYFWHAIKKVNPSTKVLRDEWASCHPGMLGGVVERVTVAHTAAGRPLLLRNPRSCHDAPQCLQFAHRRWWRGDNTDARGTIFERTAGMQGIVTPGAAACEVRGHPGA